MSHPAALHEQPGEQTGHPAVTSVVDLFGIVKSDAWYNAMPPKREPVRPLVFTGRPDSLNQNSPDLATPPVFNSSRDGKLAYVPPRPPNPWILYRCDKLKDIRDGKYTSDPYKVVNQAGLKMAHLSFKENTQQLQQGALLSHTTTTPWTSINRLNGLRQAELSKIIARLWTGEPPEVRQKYALLSKMKKKEVRRWNGVLC